MKENEGAVITAVYDPENAEAVAEELEHEWLRLLDELVQSDDVDCDRLIICTKNPWIKAVEWKMAL